MTFVSKFGTNLVSVELPNGVTSIGTVCFQDCQQLQKVSLPNSVETIGSNCFASCPKLTILEIDKKKGEIAGVPWGLIIGDRGIKWLR